MNNQVIVMGASAGGISALKTVLSGIGDYSDLSIVIVIHMKEKENEVPRLFQNFIKMRVKEAEDKEAIQNGHIYFAPPGYHLLIEEDGVFTLSTEAKVNYSRPSIDLLFETAAEAYTDQLVGILLTGANEDGAQGMKRIEELGGTVIVQTPETAYCHSMPQAAIEMVPECMVMDLEGIKAYLEVLTRGENNE
jgi:two-component system chemotaxis response regulator CheB